jgi:hypothetical protein
VSEPLRAIEAEADAAPLGAAVPLVTDAGEFDVTVPPPGKWRTRANRALREGDFDSWAELVLSAEDFDSWIEADPTNDDVEAFFKAWADVTGESRGKSSTSAASSRSTRRR